MIPPKELIDRLIAKEMTDHPQMSPMYLATKRHLYTQTINELTAMGIGFVDNAAVATTPGVG